MGDMTGFRHERVGLSEKRVFLSGLMGLRREIACVNRVMIPMEVQVTIFSQGPGSSVKRYDQ